MIILSILRGFVSKKQKWGILMSNINTNMKISVIVPVYTGKIFKTLY